MVHRDYYKILGLGTEATFQEIKSRFRQLALRYHPDRNPENPRAAERFKLVAEAYYVLGDADRRRLYDGRGSQGLEESGHRGFRHTGDVFTTFGDELRSFLGLSGDQPRRGPLPGADLCLQLELSFEEAALGAEKRIEISRMETCRQCQGNGSRSSTREERCAWCDGSGSFSGNSSVWSSPTACLQCGGKGRLARSFCDVCEGLGRREVRTELAVSIPAGVEGGTRLKFTGGGDGGDYGGQPGDLYLVLYVGSHPYFTRCGQDVLCRFVISPSRANIGGPVTVPTLTGGQLVNVPPGTVSGTRVCLPNEGIVNPDTGERGNQIIQFEVRATG